MYLSSRVFSALATSCAALTFLTTGLAGCSGGGSSNVPGARTAASGAPKAPASIIAVQNVDRSAAGAIAAKVIGSTAYATPVKGQRPASIAVGRAIRTGGAQDLSYYGGQTISSEQSYDLYVNCGTTCWGGTDPGAFLVNYGASDMIHIIDQYTYSTAPNRYTYAGGITTNYDTSHQLSDQDIYNIVHSAAAVYGTGYGKMYHVFLQNGVQQCSQAAGGCYGQNYCAYHGNVNFGDIGHVIYSVEPYQGISVCQNGSLVDSTASVLSHEVTEAITDPDVPGSLAWYNSSYGEIGDICRFNYGTVTLNGTSYYMQQEYSNVTSACTFTPPPPPTWHVLQGAASSVGAGPGFDPIVVGSNAVGPPGNFALYQWVGSAASGSFSRQLNGYAWKVAVSPEGTLWALTADHQISRSNGAGGYDVLPGSAREISVTTNGTAYVVGDDPVGPAGNYGVHRWNGTTWVQVNGYASKVSVSSDGLLWAVTADLQISRANSSGGYDVLPGAAYAIAAAPHGMAYVIGTSPTGPGGYQIYQYTGTTWAAVPGGYGVAVAVSPDGSTVYSLGSDSSIRAYY